MPLKTVEHHMQTVMFLVAGGHLLLFITRSERWVFLPPFPALPLFGAIVLTQILAVLMCGLGAGSSRRSPGR